MDGEGLYSTILQTLSEFHDYFALIVPAQASLDRHRLSYGLDDALGDHHHFVRIAHHAGSRTPGSDFADRTAEVDVDDITAVTAYDLVGVVGHPGGFDHGVRVAAVNLYSYRSLVIGGL